MQHSDSPVPFRRLLIVCPLIVIAGILALGSVLAFSYTWLLCTFLILAVGGLGFSLGSVSGRLSPQDQDRPTECNDGEIGPREAAIARPEEKGRQHLRTLINDLSRMHGSDDLCERYEIFMDVLEDGLESVLGPCEVSLWCPDAQDEYLIPSQIRPGRIDSGTYRRWSQEQAGQTIPLTDTFIHRALETRQPQWTESLGLPIVQGSKQSGFDGCIPLFREYGRPLLVLFGRTGMAQFPVDKAALLDRTALIRIFWDQMQATNQRQWLIDHNLWSGALEESSFLAQAQEWIRQARQHNELFSLVVMTIRGFRGMFAGHADKWRRGSGTFVRQLQTCLAGGTEPVLVGCMADDVFAILLMRKDAFLAQSYMERIGQTLQSKQAGDPVLEEMGLLALDVQWTLEDQSRVQGNLEASLNAMYQNLFQSEAHEHRITGHWVLGKQTVEAGHT